MTAMAPQPRRQPEAGSQSQPAPAVAREPQRQGQAQAAQRRDQAVHRQAPAVPPQGQAARSAAPGSQSVPALRRLASTTPRQLRIVRGVAAAACLVPGTAAFVTLSSAAAPSQETSPAIIRAQLGRDTAGARSAAAVAWATGTESDRQAAVSSLAAIATDLGRAAVVRPDWSRHLEQAQATVAAQVLPITSGLGTKPADPTTTTALAAALDHVGSVPGILPTLTDATGNDTRRNVVWGLGGVSVLALLGASGWLARKTHRVVNPGLGMALLGTVAVAFLAGQTLASMVTSSGAEAIAGARVDAANATAAEAGTLLTPSAAAQAARDRDDALRVGQNKLTSAGVGGAETAAWQRFAGAKLPLPSTAPKPDAVSGRLADLATLDGALASAQRSADSGLRGYVTPIGYGLLGLSILSAAAAWTGVERRVSEYR